MYLKIKYFILLCCFYAVSLNAQKQEKEIAFKISAPEQVLTGEKFRVVYRLINAEEDTGIELIEKNKVFDVLQGPVVSTSLSTQYIEGKKVTEFTKSFIYTMVAKNKGKFKLPVASVKVKGKTYKSNQSEIKIITSADKEESRKKNQKQAISDSDAFLKPVVEEIDVDGKKGFSVSYRLYTLIDLQDIANIDKPDFSDFDIIREWTPSNMGSVERYNGKEYYIIDVRRFILLPKKSGKIKVGEGKLELVFSVASGIIEQTIFGPVERMQQVVRTFTMDPFEVDAGLVGDWNLVQKIPEKEQIVDLVI